MKSLVEKIPKDARKLATHVQEGADALGRLSTRARRVLDAQACHHPVREVPVNVSPAA